MKKLKSKKRIKRVGFFACLAPSTIKEIKRRAKSGGISQGLAIEIAVDISNKIKSVPGIGFGVGQFSAKKNR